MKTTELMERFGITSWDSAPLGAKLNLIRDVHLQYLRWILDGYRKTKFKGIILRCWGSLPGLVLFS
ncbi:hypothetical protein OK016_11180 [Vibrio chagasii]|nr:hypothetical protein [Vibrio chagasii]